MKKIKLTPKGKIIIIGTSLFLLLFFSFALLRYSFARYEVSSKLNANISRALYILDSSDLDFNIDSAGIVPSADPYVYQFSISNFKDDIDTDVDINYHISIRTTTNLPITLELYRNQNYNAPGATNILGGATLENDEDGAWYRIYDGITDYPMYYSSRTTDIYTLVVNFPASYSSDITYANYIEHIEVKIDSRQMD